MRIRKAKRCRSATWWGVILCGASLVGAYVLFGMLDVDGSQMHRWPGHALVVASAEVAAERVFRAEFALSLSADRIPPARVRLPSPAARGVVVTSTLLRMRPRCAFPRRSPAAEHALGSGATLDPLSLGTPAVSGA